MTKDAIIKGLQDRIAELEREFRTEKDAKNEAYDFIISNGYLAEYRDWHFQHIGENHHSNCIKGLTA